jgi:succinate dehydrogenase / fumarate reductase iron-sulfur subunit
MLVRIKRQKGPNENSYWQSFEYNGSLDATVVTVINSINYTDDIYDIEGNHAERIRWECSCMQGVCGGCAMIINGKPSLACDTFLKDLKSEELILEPLSKFPVIADLMVDRSIIYKNLQLAKLYLNDRSEVLKKDHPHRYSISKCLKCGLCLEVCPNYQYGKDFFGGLFANEAYLIYSAQTKDKEQIIKTYNEHFVSNCSKALSCQSICPAKIETLTSILRMNRAKK